MADNNAAFAAAQVSYYPYVEPVLGAGKGLLEALGQQAALVVTDDFPAFFIPRAAGAASRRVSVRMEAVDSSGLLPVRSTHRSFLAAASFRRFLQANLPEHLTEFPSANPLDRAELPRAVDLPEDVTSRWPPTGLRDMARRNIAALPIDHRVRPVASTGGTTQARRVLGRFVTASLGQYVDERNEPSSRATSGLSPYLHFGHISAHEVFSAVVQAEDWSPARLAPTTDGRRSGWWGMSASAEAFLDQLVTWRELAFNTCATNPQFDSYSSLPEWARRSLDVHASDRRPVIYTLEQMEAAETHDPVWNAAQSQLSRQGVIHNYMRMLWGKKIIEWSPDPREALHRMIELNDRYALDGRDPNSYSGIFWCLGRYDRPWFPERPIFGTVRFMSSASTARKFDLRRYLAEHPPAEVQVGVGR
jgi:deoxyribodipyrimidine photo-lyase